MLLVAISVITTGLVLGVIFSLVAAGRHHRLWQHLAADPPRTASSFFTAALICWSFATWLAMRRSGPLLCFEHYW